MSRTRFSLFCSACFVTLLIWGGCKAADGLVEEPFSGKPATTIGYHPNEMMTSKAIYGESALPFACGENSHSCMDICDICHKMYGAPTMTCLSTLFSHGCLSPFESEMESLNNTDWCIWDSVRGLYGNLSLCTEEISDCLLIPWPNPLVEEIFVDIHSRFFKDCPAEELSDPPPVVVFALVITPICLIPVMVLLVVFKTMGGDGSS